MSAHVIIVQPAGEIFLWVAGLDGDLRFYGMEDWMFTRFVVVLAFVAVSGCASKVQGNTLERLAHMEREIKQQEKTQERLARMERKIKQQEETQECLKRKVMKHEDVIRRHRKRIKILCRFRRELLQKRRKCSNGKCTKIPFTTCDGFWSEP